MEENPTLELSTEHIDLQLQFNVAGILENYTQFKLLNQEKLKTIENDGEVEILLYIFNNKIEVREPNQYIELLGKSTIIKIATICLLDNILLFHNKNAKKVRNTIFNRFKANEENNIEGESNKHRENPERIFENNFQFDKIDGEISLQKKLIVDVNAILRTFSDVLSNQDINTKKYANFINTHLSTYLEYMIYADSNKIKNALEKIATCLTERANAQDKDEELYTLEELYKINIDSGQNKIESAFHSICKNRSIYVEEDSKTISDALSAEDKKIIKSIVYYKQKILKERDIYFQLMNIHVAPNNIKESIPNGTYKNILTEDSNTQGANIFSRTTSLYILKSICDGISEADQLLSDSFALMCSEKISLEKKIEEMQCAANPKNSCASISVEDQRKIDRKIRKIARLDELIHANRTAAVTLYSLSELEACQKEYIFANLKHYADILQVALRVEQPKKHVRLYRIFLIIAYLVISAILVGGVLFALFKYAENHRNS